MPFLSIIIAALKIDTALKTTLNSLFDQHFQDIEIIIQGLDENSSSCLEFQSVHDWKGRLLFSGKEDTGIYDAFNKALQYCHGEWIIFLGSGDFCLNHQCIDITASALKNLPDSCNFYSIPVVSVFPTHRTIETIYPSCHLQSDLPQGMCLPHQGLFHRRRLFTHEKFNTQYQIAGDYDFICRVVTPDTLICGENPCFAMIVGGISSSPQQLPLRENEFLRISRKYFPLAFPWKIYLRLVRAHLLLWCIKFFGESTGSIIADLPRWLCGKPSLWSSTARHAPGPLPPLTDSPSIDLMVATKGRVYELERLLESLRQQSFQKFHVVIADQNPEGTLDALLNKYADLSLTRITVEDRGVSYARNVLLAHGSSEIVAFPDDDCWYAPDVLERVVHFFATHADAGSVLGVLPGTVTGCLRNVSKYSAFYASGILTMFFRRYLVEQVGCFDIHSGPRPDSPYDCGEDTDYLLRAIYMGYTVCRDPLISIGHPAADFQNFTKIKGYAQGRMHILSKHQFPIWFSLLNILYPLFRIPFDIPNHGFSMCRYRFSIFKERFIAFIKLYFFKQ